MAEYLNIEQFLKKSREGTPIIDVRSPAEYEHAHIPNATNIPLFDNEQRAIVGTIYKRQGRTLAIQKGLEFVGPQLREFTRIAFRLKSDEVLIHCWRGGMRSSSMAWLLELVGLKCYLLEGGYKAYRNYVLNYFARDYKLIILGGCTGSGKTDLLESLQKAGEQTLDLEAIARHKGSAFGAIGKEEQPSSEHFENLLFDELSKLEIYKPIWTEDESINIGKVFIPKAIWNNMLQSELIEVKTDYDIRLNRILRDYACFDKELLIDSIKKIEKRLGYDKCKVAIQACLDSDLKKAATICLAYYDKLYLGSLESRFAGNPHLSIEIDTLNTDEIVPKLLSLINTKKNE